MKSKFAFSILLVMVAIPSLALAQSDPSGFPLTPICDLNLDEDGDCITDAVGDTVCIRGVVLAWKEFGSRGPGAIQDLATGCCFSVFDITDAPDLPEGTLVEVCGWVGNFAGLAEIIDQPGQGSNDPVVTVLDSVPVPVPCTPISAADVAPDNPLAEELESCLVELCGHFEDGGGDFLPFSANYRFIDTNGDTTEIRIDSDTGIEGTPIPAGNVSVKGILAQFNGFQDMCNGYQILPRSLADITAPKCEVDVDIKPGSCVNPFNTGAHGVLPVALLGSDVLDVNDVDISSITLNGVPALRGEVEDVSSPTFGGGECPCNTDGADGHADLVLKFKTQDVAATLPPSVQFDTHTLILEGSTLAGLDFSGGDCVSIRTSGAPPFNQGGVSLSITRDLNTSVNRISFALTQGDEINLGVYDVAGRLVTRLYQGHKAQGQHDIGWSSASHPAGVYFVRLEGQHLFLSKKFVVLE